MKKPYRWFAFMAMIGLMLAGCGHKKPTSVIAAVNGTDTLTMAQAVSLRPDSLADSVRVLEAMTQRTLSRQCRSTIAPGRRDTLVLALMQQLSLRSGVEWNRESAGALFDATCGLRALLDTMKSVERVAAYLDSVLGRSTLANGSKLPAVPVCSRAASSPAEVRFDSLIACILGVSPEVGRTLEQFLLSSTTEKRDLSKASAMIKGLVFDASRKSAKVSAPTAANGPLDNSESVLKFRSSQSIKDTIAKHQVNIRELYKKQLKLNARLAGTVVVQFRVAADGSVLDAAVAQSQIKDAGFLESLIGYARTIRFKPVPPTAGAMKFEFPFEFSPEE